MTNINSKAAFGTLLVGHVAGMIDMAALPIWVGTLIGAYGFAPPVAGGMVTLFLGGIVLASLAASVIFARVRPRIVAPLGYGVAMVAFVAMAFTSDVSALATLHLLAGVATGAALSAVHGAMGLTLNPMKVFGCGGAALGVGAILFLGGAPFAIDAGGRTMVFVLLAGVMGLASVISLALFPDVAIRAPERAKAKFGALVWFPVLGILLMALMQAMMFSFVERIGVDRGFSSDLIRLTLVSVGVVNMAPGIIAAMLQHRFNPLNVAMVGAFCQAALAIGISTVTQDWAYMVTVLLFPPMMMFSHTFVFGYLTRIEPTGRAVSATPAMIMSGAAVGPLLGGLAVEGYGYQGLACAAFVVGLCAFALFVMSVRASRALTLASRSRSL